MDLYHSFKATQPLSHDAINMFKWSQVSQRLFLISSCHLFIPVTCCQVRSFLVVELRIRSIAYAIISKLAELAALVYPIGNPFKSKTQIFNQNPKGKVKYCEEDGEKEQL